MDSRDIKRITIFAGHYGSGKTNVAVNYALYMSKYRTNVSIADLDIVNPYFRSKDSSKVLESNGIRLISSRYANTNVDTPALPAEAYSVVDDLTVNAVIDVGGDDRGALALGRYVPAIIKENDYEMLFVINKYRYLTSTPADTVEVMKEIETASCLKFTGIVNNSNLGEETDADAILNSVQYANEIANLTSLKIKMTSVKSELAEALYDKIDNLFPINLYVRQSWLKGEK